MDDICIRAIIATRAGTDTRQVKDDTDDWTRTSTLLLRTDFESVVSTNSTTSAFGILLDEV